MFGSDVGAHRTYPALSMFIDANPRKQNARLPCYFFLPGKKNQFLRVGEGILTDKEKAPCLLSLFQT